MTTGPQTRIDVWLVADRFVCEAYLGGMQIGEAAKLDMTQYNVVRQLTKAEFDELMLEFLREEGYFPDT